ncbi:8500_t:CDS:2 [Cetraspora pellucida]|uniref:8500_t:CDS:1 n=1 Tax=Cetraspora pellucida TaxID=1433469 RepID=A0A9N9BFV3_9GLOM|nr:8500_t:CDS:2 [Cetraspora pellucida]
MFSTCYQYNYKILANLNNIDDKLEKTRSALDEFEDAKYIEEN